MGDEHSRVMRRRGEDVLKVNREDTLGREGDAEEGRGGVEGEQGGYIRERR